MAAEVVVVGRNIGKGRLNRWLLRIIGPANVGSARPGPEASEASPEPPEPEAAPAPL